MSTENAVPIEVPIAIIAAATGTVAILFTLAYFLQKHFCMFAEEIDGQVDRRHRRQGLFSELRAYDSASEIIVRLATAPELPACDERPEESQMAIYTV